MQPAKLDIAIFLFCYAGTSDMGSVNPQLAIWLAKTIHQLKLDERIGRVSCDPVDECPTDYARDVALAKARKDGFDLVLMLDADNWPDARVGKYKDAVPFMDVALPLAYDRLLEGKPTLIGAPYCSGPPEQPSTFKGEVPLIYNWERTATEDDHAQFQIGMASRQEAALMKGLQRVPAIATGVCLMSANIVDDMPQPWFYYEFDPVTRRKTSTEDIVFSRNMGMAWLERIGEHVVFLAADSWAYHRKPKWVGKPEVMHVDDACAAYRETVLRGVRKGQRIIDVGAESGEALVPLNEYAKPTGERHYGNDTENTPFAEPEIWISEDLPNDFDLEAASKRWAESLEKDVPTDPPGEPEGVEATVPPAEKSEGITSFLYRGHPIRKFESDEWSGIVKEQMEAFNSMAHPSRMLVAFTCLGSDAAVFATLASEAKRPLTIFCCGTSPLKAAEANLSGFKPPVFVVEIKQFLDAANNQDLDLIWLGHPPDPNTALEAVRKFKRHVRPGGYMAGPADENTELALMELGIHGDKLTWIDEHDKRVWYLQKPVKQP
jgi:hypothetical protein